MGKKKAVKTEEFRDIGIEATIDRVRWFCRNVYSDIGFSVSVFRHQSPANGIARAHITVRWEDLPASGDKCTLHVEDSYFLFALDQLEAAMNAAFPAVAVCDDDSE